MHESYFSEQYEIEQKPKNILNIARIPKSKMLVAVYFLDGPLGQTFCLLSLEFQSDSKPFTSKCVDAAEVTKLLIAETHLILQRSGKKNQQQKNTQPASEVDNKWVNFGKFKW